MGRWCTGSAQNYKRQIYQTEDDMNYSKTAIEKAVQAFQIIYGVTVTQWHCEKLLCLVGQAHEAEEVQQAQAAPAVAPNLPEYDACCGSPATCEQPCFHRRATPAGDGWGTWIEWSGGECPLKEGVYAEVMLRTGKTHKGRALVGHCLEAPQWRTGFPHDPTPSPQDIVRYRVKL